MLPPATAAIAALPGEAMVGKATKWAALALKSRASLYAARIAKYHPQSADGLTSIPASLAGGYYTMSHASASAIIDSGKHPLHRGGGTYQKTFSEVLDMTFKRIQFTPDLMPSDITGTELIDLDQETGQRSFRFFKNR